MNGSNSVGLDIIVIGGGLAGLGAAIALRQKGHHVTIYEQSRFANEVGAAIHMTPNATGILGQLGLDPADSGAIPLTEAW
jgi:2-polyprenyl-6-methoxyphenol hydroxylase-like FAD-dependent oxidoreductase